MASARRAPQSARPVSLLLGLARPLSRAERRGWSWRARLALARPALFRLHRHRERIREARRALLARGRDAQLHAVHLSSTVLAHAGCEATAPATRHGSASC